MVHPYFSTDTAIAFKKFCFVLSDRSDFHMAHNLAIAFHAFTSYMLSSLSIDEILLSRYGNWSTNFRGSPLRVEMAPSYLKHTSSLYLYQNMRDIGLMSRVFANGPGNRGSIPGRVIPNTQKMVIDAALLSTQHYKVRIKSKVEQSTERSSVLPYTLV